MPRRSTGYSTTNTSAISDDLPKIRHYLKFTEHLGLPDCTWPDFGLASLDGTQLTPRIIRDLNHPFAAIVLGTSWESKNWNSEGYAGLIQRILADRALKVVLLGDDSQAELAANLVETFKTPDLISLVGQTTLPQLAAVLQAAKLGIGPDSGPGHVAAAVKTPFITLFGPTSPQRTAPFGNEHLVVNAEAGCAPCYKKYCADRNNQCMQSILPDAVMKKVSLALCGIKEDSRQ